MNPRIGLEQLAAVCLACQEIVAHRFEMRGWTLSDWKCADQCAIDVDRKCHALLEHDSWIKELWNRVLLHNEGVRADSHVLPLNELHPAHSRAR
jgi:hypothetical protein